MIYMHLYLSIYINIYDYRQVHCWSPTKLRLQVSCSSKLCAWNKSKQSKQSKQSLWLIIGQMEMNLCQVLYLPSNINDLRPFWTVDPARNFEKILQKLLYVLVAFRRRYENTNIFHFSNQITCKYCRLLH